MGTKTLPLPDIEQEAWGKSDYLPLYKVIMWNDNVTTMEFVVRVLIKIFGKDYQTAEGLMYEVHHTGAAHVATLPLEVAEFKVEQVHSAAAVEPCPLTCTIEPV
ncbi:MAG: Clp protease ClpS [Nitrospinae bacterium RIFCSPLOWO2_12_FULL_47_7]|nr:MAG: Clp protease ClpS [Nitrospinae bacterium RIFCSPLOWO2_12_FULL_47_7]